MDLLDGGFGGVGRVVRRDVVLNGEEKRREREREREKKEMLGAWEKTLTALILGEHIGGRRCIEY